MELLTGKSKKEFKAWILKKDDGEKYRFGQNISTNFYDFPLSMQWGIYQDFFESKYIRIYNDNRIIGWKQKIVEFQPVIITKNDLITLEFFEVRREARTKAIEKANELYNNES